MEDQEWLAYEHPSGIFTLEYPENWQIEEQQTPQQFQTSLRSGDGSVFFRLSIQPATEEHTISVLEELSEQFLETSHGGKVGYLLDSLDRQADDSVLANYVYGEGDQMIVGDLLYWVDESYLLRLEIEQVEASAEETQDIVDDIINTLEFAPDISFEG